MATATFLRFRVVMPPVEMLAVIEKPPAPSVVTLEILTELADQSSPLVQFAVIGERPGAERVMVAPFEEQDPPKLTDPVTLLKGAGELNETLPPPLPPIVKGIWPSMGIVVTEPFVVVK